ncbi:MULTISPECIES: TRAP transporter large permease subunit [Oceanithermus]|uniref:C4-dicarboxylate ABC transporter permease n=2 Tax=Oceanithermus desulfurans TaxID=227924 RepID=A0A511RI46_9DEIN|nr:MULTISPECIES: TRAP transporter large permease subunit [Oceanithermus]MBB6030375.1 tripartite ATP-independent transporter DctM subunit [Oceanithermus desulfurans]GEM89324.1 C4-dicarboxylate ABC transporter permease [Oceanithermus desulfurans NBRC 100063]
MDPLVAVVVLLAILFLLLGLSVWVFVSLFAVALVSIDLFTSTPPLRLLGNIAWNATDSWALVALPLFIFMGELLLRTRISERMFDGLAPWLAWLPGRLLHTNVVASTIFAAVSGSSAATAATIGKINIPELRKRGYDDDLILGSLAGAGTLGFLIPPSLVMIIYGVLAEVSIGKLFIAGVIPGLLLAGGFMLYLVYAGLRWPEKAPGGDRYTWGDRFVGLVNLVPVTLLILLVLGSIYMGFATPTESAAIGVLGAFLLALAYRSLTLESFKQAVLGSVRTTSMIGLIIAGASLLSTAMGFMGIPTALAAWIASLGLSKYLLVVVIALFYVVLGFFLDGISMIVITLPITLPLVTQAGFSPLWFGIFLVLMVEAAQITPPVGFNLFVIQGVARAPILRVARAALPFFVILMGLAALITVWPEVVLFLPQLMRG